MKRAGVVALYAIGGYLSLAVAGYLLVSVLSSNTHGRSVEAAGAMIVRFSPPLHNTASRVRGRRKVP
jgi:hypothetical protein